jgi:hypothetical protein
MSEPSGSPSWRQSWPPDHLPDIEVARFLEPSAALSRCATGWQLSSVRGVHGTTDSETDGLAHGPVHHEA